MAEQKKEREQLKPVVEASKSKKKSNIRRDAENVIEYSWTDILLPVLKTTIMDLFNNGLRMFLYPGDDYRGKPTSSRRYTEYSRGGNPNYTNYRQYSRDDRPVTHRDSSRSRHQVDDVYVPTRGEAEMVRDQLNEALDTYGTVTVADFYDSVGLESNYVDKNWGWYDLTDMRIVSTRDGFLLEMPRIEPL